MRKSFLITAVAMSLLAIVSCGSRPQDTGQTQTTTPAGEFSWTNFDKAQEKAKADGRVIILDFSTEWCGWCKKMEKDTYHNAAVMKIIEQSFVASMVDPEKPDKYTYQGKECTGEDLKKLFNVGGYPTTVYLKSDGSYIDSKVGYIGPDKYPEVLNEILAKSK